MAKSHREKTAEALRRFRAAHAEPGGVSAANSRPEGAAAGAAGSLPDGARRLPRKGRNGNDDVDLPADLRANELLSRDRLIARWKCGSDSTFHRAERDRLLVPRRDGARTGYSWTDVFSYEGGRPPANMEAAYREDLMTATQAAALTPYVRDTIIQKAKRGEIPFRRIGRSYRFVRAEILRWLESWS